MIDWHLNQSGRKLVNWFPIGPGVSLFLFVCLFEKKREIACSAHMEKYKCPNWVHDGSTWLDAEGMLDISFIIPLSPLSQANSFFLSNKQGNAPTHVADLWVLTGSIHWLYPVSREQATMSHPVTVRHVLYLAAWTHAQNQNNVEHISFRGWLLDVELRIEKVS